MEPRKHVLMAGGGTGGHVFPGFAVASELERRGWSVSWVGRQGEMEERLVSERGLDFHPLPARAVVGRGPLAKLSALGTLLGSALAARRLIRRAGVGVVLGTGGYVSAPAVVGARLAGCPRVLLEPNARAGAANRWLSRWSQAAALAYPAAREDFRCPSHLTGVPVRPEFFELPEAPKAPRVLVLGGSQGALKLNVSLPDAFERLAREVPELEIVHQVGRHEERTRAEYARRDLGSAKHRIVPFIDDVARAMGDATLIVSRAGAVTLAEICAAARPAVLIPLSLAAGHQRDNARALVEAGGAIMLDEETSPEEIAGALARLLTDAGRRSEMSVALSALARRDAAARIADLLVSTAAGEPS